MTDVDVVIVGGGVQGLLVLRSLNAAGYSAVLFERDRLGAGQTGHSQAYLIHGHVYAPGMGKNAGVQTAVRGPYDPASQSWPTAPGDTPFRRGASEWSLMVANLGIPAVGDAYHLPGSRLSNALRMWTEAKLVHAAVKGKRRPPALQSRGALFRSDETFVPDAAELVKRLSQGHESRIRQGDVVDVNEAIGEVRVILNGASSTVRAGAVVIACPATNLAPWWTPKLTTPNKLVALFAKGPGTPDFALVAHPTVTYRLRKTDPGAAPGSAPIGKEPLVARAWGVMAVPRVNHERPGETAWLCTALVDADAADWQRSLAAELCKFVPSLEGLEFGAYVETHWPEFDADTAYQIGQKELAVAAYPVRLTLAPLAASDVLRRVSDLFKTRGTSRVPEPSLPGVFPGVAEELWRSTSTHARDALPLW